MSLLECTEYAVSMDIDTMMTNNNDEDDKNNNNDTKTSEDELLSMLLRQKLRIAEVIIHPLVLLSVADHYHRVARGTRKRVIGILLGQSLPGGTMDITNSIAVPFEEDSKRPLRTRGTALNSDSIRQR